MLGRNGGMIERYIMRSEVASGNNARDKARGLSTPLAR
jgi:hypothetical protein